jgi:ParB/RepB/Spo0J family partition protein
MKVVNNLNISIIKMHPRNQEYFDDIEGEAYERFKNSIKNDGILTPLLVAPDMTLISGHQRLKAAKELGIDTVPVIVEEDLKSESEIFRKLLAANFGRFKNNPIKQAKFIEEYEKQCGVRQGSAGNADPNNSGGITQKDVAKQFGISDDQLRNYKKLLTLIPDLQDMVETDKLSATTAYKVYAKLSPDEQKKLLLDLGVEKISKMTKSQAESEVEKLLLELEESKGNERRVYEDYQTIKDELSKVRKQKQEVKEVEKIIEKVVEKPVEKIVEKKVEVKVVPEDYEQLKHDYQELKRNCDLVQYENEFPKTEKKYDIGITHFRGLLSIFGQQLGDYVYSDTYFNQIALDEKEQFLSEIEDFKLFIGMLEKNINNSKNSKEVA